MNNDVEAKDGWRSILLELKANNQFTQAQELLEEELAQADNKDEIGAMLAELINVCFTLSRHQKAFEYSEALIAHSGEATINRKQHTRKAIKICVKYLLARKPERAEFKAMTEHLLPGIEPKMSWNYLNTCLFGTYWNKMEYCFHYLYGMLIRAENQEQFLYTIGLLGYSLSFSGYSVIGNRVLRKAIKEAKRAGYNDYYKNLSIHLAIGYCICYRQDKSRKICEEFEETVSLFHQLLVKACQLSLAITCLGPKATQQAIEEVQNQNVGLINSHSYIQVYGAQAMLMALANQHEQAISYLVKAKVNADFCASPLNYVFYYRYEATMWALMNKHDRAKKSIAKGRHYAKEYGRPLWNLFELNRIEAVIGAAIASGYSSRAVSSLRFIWKGLTSLNYRLVLESFKLTLPKLMTVSAVYWDEKQSVDYLRSYLAVKNEENIITAKSADIIDINQGKQSGDEYSSRKKVSIGLIGSSLEADILKQHLKSAGQENFTVYNLTADSFIKESKSIHIQNSVDVYVYCGPQAGFEVVASNINPLERPLAIVTDDLVLYEECKKNKAIALIEMQPINREKTIKILALANIDKSTTSLVVEKEPLNED